MAGEKVGQRYGVIFVNGFMSTVSTFVEYGFDSIVDFYVERMAFQGRRLVETLRRSRFEGALQAVEETELTFLKIFMQIFENFEEEQMYTFVFAINEY